MLGTVQRGCDTVTFPMVNDPGSDTPTRRTALKVGGGGALAALLGLGAGWVDHRNDLVSDSSAGNPEPPPTTTSSLAVGTENFPAVGPVDAGIIALGSRVVATTGWREVDALAAELPGPMGDPIVQAKRVASAEFQAGKTMMVDGWVLSASEARAAAILALLCDDNGC